MTEGQDQQDQIVLTEFRRRLEHIATISIEQRPHLDSMSVAGTFLAVGMTILVRELGPERATNYLRELANEYELAKCAESGSSKPN